MVKRSKRISPEERFANPEIDSKIVMLEDQITDTPKNKSSDKKTNVRTKEQLPSQVSEQMPAQMPKQIPEQIPEQMLEQISKPTNQQGAQQIDKSANQQTIKFDLLNKPKNLTDKQYAVLWYIYFNRPFRVSGEEGVGKHFSPAISYGTVRSILVILEKKEYIKHPFSITDGTTKATTCFVNELKCIPIFGHSSVINSEQIDKSTNLQIVQQNDISPNQQINPQSKLPIIDKKKDFKKISFFLEGSKFYENEGIYFEKILEWMEEFPIFTEEKMFQQLQFVEYKCKVLLFKPKKTVSDYLYGTFAAGRAITRPKGYESIEEIADREYIEEMEKKKERHKKIKKLKEQELEWEKSALEDEIRSDFEIEIKNSKTLKSLINDYEESRSDCKTTSFKKKISEFQKTGTLPPSFKIILNRFYMKKRKDEINIGGQHE